MRLEIRGKNDDEKDTGLEILKGSIITEKYGNTHDES